MSATGRSDVRVADDFYATPGWCTRSILPILGPLDSLSVLEPCAGDGAIVRELLQAGARHVVAVERDEGRARTMRDTITDQRVSVRFGDFLTDDSFNPADLMRFDLVLTNPPYRDALAFVQRSLSLVRPGGAVVMLLRLNWLASQRRASWLREHTPSVHVLPKRPSFTGEGTDATDYAWMVWRVDTPTTRYRPTVRVLEVSP